MTMMILVATAVAACRNMPWTMKFAAVTSCQTTTLAMVELAQPWARGQAAKLQVAEKASAALDRSHFDFLLGHGLSLSGIGSARLHEGPTRCTLRVRANMMDTTMTTSKLRVVLRLRGTRRVEQSRLVSMRLVRGGQVCTAAGDWSKAPSTGTNSGLTRR